MKKDIHPEYVETQVTCTCGNSFTTRSTAKSGQINAEVAAGCYVGAVGGAVDFLHKPVEPQVIVGKGKVFVELFQQRRRDPRAGGKAGVQPGQRGLGRGVAVQHGRTAVAEMRLDARHEDARQDVGPAVVGGHPQDLVPLRVVAFAHRPGQLDDVDDGEDDVEAHHRPHVRQPVVGDEHEAADQVDDPQPEQLGLQERDDEDRRPDPAERLERGGRQMPRHPPSLPHPPSSSPVRRARALPSPGVRPRRRQRP